MIELTTCGARGKEGPRIDDCTVAYNQTEMSHSVRVIGDLPYKGVQVWKAPGENYYT